MNYYLVIAIIIILSMLCSVLSVKMVKGMLLDAGVVRKNYKGEDIPVAVGLCFIPAIVVGIIPLVFYGALSKYIMAYIFLVTAMSFAGIIDDAFGDRNASGFKGHIGNLLHGKLTTGGFKAVFGGLCALVISAFLTKNIGVIVLNTLIIALFTNLLNLFDLRPGRAVKTFWIFSIMIFISLYLLKSCLAILICIPIITGTIIYFKGDVKAEYMMGDAGSNILGSSLGFISALSLNTSSKLIMGLVLLFLNLLSEKVSFTKLIQNNKFLNWIDMIGRN